jgi:sec-independent protein translocase protein TatB
MLPGVGGSELIVIAIVALIVVGPKDLPVLMRKVGQVLGRLRGMAAEFRASFDEMARQSELDELRKEVEALRRGQMLDPVRAEMEPVFKDIEQELHAPGQAGDYYPPGWGQEEAAPEPEAAAPAAEPEPAPSAEPKKRKPKPVSGAKA